MSRLERIAHLLVGFVVLPLLPITLPLIWGVGCLIDKQTWSCGWRHALDFHWFAFTGELDSPWSYTKYRARREGSHYITATFTPNGLVALKDSKPAPAPLIHEHRDTEVLAWRAWRLTEDVKLMSTVVDFVWDGPVVRNEAAPNVGWSNQGFMTSNLRTSALEAGFHAAKKRANPFLTGSPIIGQVALSGTVIEGECGYRAQCATIRSLLVRETGACRDHNMWEIADILSERYQCPVEVELPECGSGYSLARDARPAEESGPQVSFGLAALQAQFANPAPLFKQANPQCLTAITTAALANHPAGFVPTSESVVAQQAQDIVREVDDRLVRFALGQLPC